MVKAESSFKMRRRDRPREPVVWSAVEMPLRSDISSLLRASGVVSDYCPDISLNDTGHFHHVKHGSLRIENPWSSEVHHLSGDICVLFSLSLDSLLF